MRQYNVLVKHPQRGTWLIYPATEGEATLANARKLEARGREVSIRTEANGFVERLTTAELAAVLA